MPFPFLPAGAVLAASVLLAALSVFGLILRAMDRALTGLRDTVVSGLVAGLRTWNASRPEPLATSSPGASSGSPWSASAVRPIAATATMPGDGDLTATERPESFPPAEVIDLDASPIEPAAIGRR